MLKVSEIISYNESEETNFSLHFCTKQILAPVYEQKKIYISNEY